MVECGQNQFVKDRNEIVLRETPNARQEIVAKIFDDIRGVITLQIQKISTKTGNPHEKTYFTFSQFVNENGINEEKFSSFELFRKNIVNPEIITFDELYERAKHIIQNPLKE